MDSGCVGEKRERVAQSRPEHGVAVPATARRAGQIDDERPPDHAGNAA
jgi:hypothetical protein